MTREQIEQKAKEIAANLGACPECVDMEGVAMEMAEWMLSHQWISVEDELPKDKQNVFIKLASKRSTCGWYSYSIDEWFISVGGICGNDCLCERVTHWMPIPPIAEEGGEK